MNAIKEYNLEEIEFYSELVEEGLSAILHTILFVRAVSQVKPQDYTCVRLAPLTFAKCGTPEVDQNVRDAIDAIGKSQVLVSARVSKGTIIISFFEKRTVKSIFSLFVNEEKVCFEKWRIPIAIHESPNMRSVARDVIFERHNECRLVIQTRLHSILEYANLTTDHLPGSNYEYEIEVCGPDSSKRESTKSSTTSAFSGIS